MNLTYEIFGEKKLPSRSEPDWNILYDDVQSIVWNISTEFVVDINSTVFYSPKDPSKRSKDVIFFHHGHSNCLCPSIETGLERYRCQPGCNSSDPKHDEIGKLGYSWWDLYNVSTFFHDLNYDVFIFSMPLKGVNLGPGSNKNQINDNHWWFFQWEQKGDRPIRYFVEPVILTANYALSKLGYDDIFMAGLSGGGWSTTIASAIDSRIKASFPTAGSVPCAMRNPLGKIPGQKWTGDDDEDYEQSCMPLDAKIVGGDNMPGRSTIAACNYTCQYLLAGLESDRFQIQILHEYDSCCFSPHGRHEQMLSYEKHIRSELEYGDLNRTSLLLCLTFFSFSFTSFQNHTFFRYRGAPRLFHCGCKRSHTS